MSTNREDWLLQAARILHTDLIAQHVTNRPFQVQIAAGWPSSRALSRKNRRIGECWAVNACIDEKTSHIFISPVCADAHKALECLAHELVHAVVGTDQGHKGEFKRVAHAIGLEGRLTSTHAGEALSEKLNEIVVVLGDYPHAPIKSEYSNPKKQSTRMLKAKCSKCGYTIRSTARWFALGLPTCCCGGSMERK